MNENTGASAEMPRYRCHKEVWALKIKEITRVPSGNATVTHYIVPTDRRYAPFEVSTGYIGKHSPQAGGYYVVYDDGYISYSPARAFEDGYRLIVRRAVKPTIEELEKILNGPEPDVTIEPDGTVTQGFTPADPLCDCRDALIVNGRCQECKRPYRFQAKTGVKHDA